MPSAFWNFDGVACAAALELGKPLYFFHANHLLYGFLGFLFWRATTPFFHMDRALPALQLFTSLLSALGLVGLCKMTLEITKDRLLSLLLTLSLSVTAAFWMWSIEAQVYPLGFTGLAWATYFLLHHRGRAKETSIGILHGLAVLGHIVHVLWLIPALYYWRYANADLRTAKRHMRRYSLVMGSTVLLSYALVILSLFQPWARGWRVVSIWLKGSAGLTADRHWQWHFPGLTGPLTWLKATFPTLWGSFSPYPQVPVSSAIWVLTALSMMLLAAFLVYSWTSRRLPLWTFAVLWLACYGIFFWTWEPTMLCYRMTDIIPIAILVSLGLQQPWSRWAKALLLETFFLSTLTVNAVTRIHPMSQTERNLAYTNALELSRMTPRTSLYLTDGGLLWMYLLYFTGRSALNATTMDAERLATTIEEQRSLRPIYVQSSLLRDANAQPWLLKQHYRQLKETSTWLQLQ